MHNTGAAQIINPTHITVRPSRGVQCPKWQCPKWQNSHSVGPEWVMSDANSFPWSGFLRKPCPQVCETPPRCVQSDPVGIYGNKNRYGPLERSSTSSLSLKHIPNIKVAGSTQQRGAEQLIREQRVLANSGLVRRSEAAHSFQQVFKR